MTEERSYEDEVSERLAQEYREAGERNDQAVEDNRAEVEEYYRKQREAHEAREREIRAYKQGQVVDTVGQPVSGPEVATESAAGPPEEVAAERTAEAQEAGADAENPDAALVSSDEGQNENDGEKKDSGDKRKAADVVKDIEAAESADEVRSLADGDDRKTVQEAAEKRLAELEAGEDESAD